MKNCGKRCSTCKGFTKLYMEEIPENSGFCYCNSTVLKNGKDAACKEYERREVDE